MCSVVGCDSRRRSAPRFKVPEDPERRLEWVQFLFEVNGQRLKESSWTDITICTEHFTNDCFVSLTETGTVHLKSSAVPSLCIKSEPEDRELCEEPEETKEDAFEYDQVSSPPSCSGDSRPTSEAVRESPTPSDVSDAFMYDYSQMLQKVANIDVIREKAALLQIKGKYVVNETRLLRLFSRKCPLCGSTVKVEKVTRGLLIIFNQQCLQCDYRNQWKSQVSVPAAEDRHLKGSTDKTPGIQQTNDGHRTRSRTIKTAAIDEVNDSTDESEEQGDTGSDEDWNQTTEISPEEELRNECDEESKYESDYHNYPQPAPKHSQLCTECGMFFSKWRPHTCEHKVKPYSCNICGRRFVSEVALNVHSRIHDEDYEYLCKYCHVTFKTKADKMTHQQTHLTQGKPYKCPYCSETFATNKERKIHLEDHRGPKQLKCHICGIEFNHPRCLRRHLAVHTGLKPYKCSVCQRGFNQPGHLKSHMRLHTGERPYKCQHCDKRFNHNVSLKSHIQRYHSTNSSGEQEKEKRHHSDISDTDSGNKKEADSGLHNTPKWDTEEEVQRQKQRCTGRRIGRPKRNAAGSLALAGQMQDSNIKTAEGKPQKIKRTHCSDEESEGEPSESDVSFDPMKEDEMSEKKTLRTRRLRIRTKKCESDSDFGLDNSKKKRYSSQNSGEGSGRQRGQPRTDQEINRRTR